MTIGELCSRDVVFVRPREAILEAARLMRHYHVGDLVVVEEQGQRRLPQGILTDRDILVRVVAEGKNPAETEVQAVMSPDLFNAGQDDEIYETLRRMAEKGVRRAPVVDGSGSLVGILSLDDVLQLLAEEMGAVARLLSRGRRTEASS